VPPKAFKTQAHLRKWLARNHASKAELFIRLYDADSFQQRYTPRKPKSNWSRVNIERMKALIAAGKAAAPGIAAFERRDKIAVAPYSFENRTITLAPAFLKRLKANPRAWKFFRSEPPGYRRITIFWVMQAKKAETRERRFRTMLARMAKGERMGTVPQNRNKKRAAST